MLFEESVFEQVTSILLNAVYITQGRQSRDIFEVFRFWAYLFFNAALPALRAAGGLHKVSCRLLLTR